MKAEPTETTPKRTHAPVEPLDMTQPIWATLYQTETRNVWETFTGKGAQASAEAHAQATALRTGKLVAVLAPQIAVYGPPAPVVPVAAKVALAFGEGV